MAKILLVEDDNNLREIYEARLQAEGYEIISAKDGEEALSIAKQEQPDLIISDIMMPRISGLEMLDILRNTEGLKEMKVIMLTALGQAEDKTRADALGADRYLVKSQVTLEDIVKTAADLLAGAPPNTGSIPAVAEPVAAPAAPAPVANTPVMSVPTVVPAAPAPTPPVTPVTAPASPAASTAAPPVPVPGASAAALTPQPTPAPAPTAPAPPTMPVASAPPALQVIPVAPPIEQAVAPTAPTPAASPVTVNAENKALAAAPPTAAERAAVQAQIAQFAGNTTPATPAAAPPNSDAMMADAVKGLVSGSPSPKAEVTPPAAPSTPAAPAASTPPASAPEPAAPPAVPPPVTPSPATPTPAIPPVPPPPTVTVPVVAPPDQPLVSSTPVPPAPPPPTSSDDDSVTISKKKIIQPLGPGATPEPANLHELLAKEGMDLNEEQPSAAQLPQANTVPGMSPMPHQPGHVISPSPISPTNSSGQPVDPNSISL